MKRLFSIITLLVLSVTVHAQMDDASRNLLIDKLSKVQSQLPIKDSSYVSVTLRLADLLSERARVGSMAELEQGCTDCKAGARDRQSAIRLYNEVFDKVSLNAKGKVLIQLGHLSQMNGAEAKASEYYRKALTEQVAPEVKSEAHLALGEMAFKARNFSEAISQYNKVLDIPAATSRGLASYRRAWSNFNLGKVEDAQKQMEEILSTPALLTRTGVAQAQVDPQFHEEVARDYATFMTKGQITTEKIESLYKLSPESIRVANVQSLATESERVGKKAEALKIWQFVYPSLTKAEERLSSHAAQAQLYFDIGDRKSALNEFSKTMDSMNEKNACNPQACEELRRRIRQFIVNWNQLEKKQASHELLEAYSLYTQRFPEDLDMLVFAGQLAKDQNQLLKADGFYAKAENTLVQNKSDAKKLESILLLRIEIAETLKDEKMMMAAYESYLKNSTLQTRSFQVRYQIARGIYEKNQYEQAATELQNLALDPKGDATIRKQAADLSLDALVLLKDDTRLQAWSQSYAQTFKANQKEFSEISQKTVLTKAATAAATDKAAAYKELEKFNPEQASAEDRVKFYKNRMILADDLKNYADVQTNADLLLKQPGLSAEDTELAWAKKAHVAELRLDFPTAIAATEKLQKAYQPEAKALKLALFSELAGQNNSDRYVQYLKVAKDSDSKQMVAQELVRKSKNPEKEIEILKPYLTGSPETLARLYAEIQAKNPASTAGKKVTSNDQLKKTSSGQLLTRIEFLKNFEALKAKIAASALDTSSDRKLAATIKSRAVLLEQLEAATKKAIDSSDWTSQLVSIDTLAKESERFYTELMSAPMPEGLSDAEVQEYMNLLSNQAAPFQSKAMAAKEKVEQFWKNSSWLTKLKKSWEETELRSLTAQEIKALQAIASPENHAQLTSLQADTIVAAQAPRPAAQDVANARRKVYMQPTDRGALQELLALEKKSENKPMVQYLQTRIENLDKGVL